MNSKRFYEAYRNAFGRLRQHQVDGLEFLLERLEDDGPDTIEQAAYILATVKHETADTFQPVREGLNASDKWRKRHLRYYPWYGRGYVQLTWERNYERVGLKLGHDLTTDPDAALDPDVAYAVLLNGMMGGWFTGKPLKRYINRDGPVPVVDYAGARRVVNGNDKAKLIASYARGFLPALYAAGFPESEKEPVFRCDLPTVRAPFGCTLTTILLEDCLDASAEELDSVIKEFQASQNLTPDGIVGGKTWNAILLVDT